MFVHIPDLIGGYIFSSSSRKPLAAIRKVQDEVYDQQNDTTSLYLEILLTPDIPLPFDSTCVAIRGITRKGNNPCKLDAYARLKEMTYVCDNIFNVCFEINSGDSVMTSIEGEQNKSHSDPTYQRAAYESYVLMETMSEAMRVIADVLIDGIDRLHRVKCENDWHRCHRCDVEHELEHAVALLDRLATAVDRFDESGAGRVIDSGRLVVAS